MPAVISILTVPAFDDNYLWIVHNGCDAIVIDPGDAEAILRALEQHKLSLRAILLTHHHPDHIGGVAALLQVAPVKVYGPGNEGIAQVSHPVHDQDTITIPSLNLNLQVIATPGHTLGHIAYYAPQLANLFCGDTLFGAGCGRLFEGSPAQMLASLDRLSELPDETQVFCAHEYTIANLRFAMMVDPNNQDLIERCAIEEEKRRQLQPTIPSQLGIEKLSNPFLRIRDPEILKSLVKHGKIPALSAETDDSDHFAALRLWKNTFK